MSRLTVLHWTRRHRCQGCGTKSRGRSLAGDMTATPDGWRCPRCLARAPALPKHAAFERGALGESETGGAAPLPPDEAAA